MRVLFVVLRVGIAAAVVAAIVGQLVTSIGFWHDRHVEHIGVTVTNFFSFFTIDSNVGTVLVCLVGAYLLLVGRVPDSGWFLVARLSIVTYMVVTGVVYNLLLRGIALPQGSTVGWSNEILHVIAPLYMLLDWLFAPGRRRVDAKWIWVVIVFPIVWVIYTLIRGPLTVDEVYGKKVWYPYPFLNPTTSPEGYFTVALYVVLISAIICGTAAGAVWVSKRLSPTGSAAR